MYTISFSGRFKKSYKLCLRRGLNPEIMAKALQSLAGTGTVPADMLPHPLHGDYEGCMECHLQPDWLLVWQLHETELNIIMVTTGSHSDIFGKKRR